MQLSKLSIQRVRNIDTCLIEPAPGTNLIIGGNGSGKTSVLEAIHILSTGRSFRSSNTKQVIQHTQESLMVLAEAIHQEEESRIGVEISRKGSRAKLNHNPISTLAELSLAFPVQVVHPQSFQLLNGEPALRRSFLDWGVFFENPAFIQVWKRYKAALIQRNAALKRQLPDKDICSWDEALSHAGEEMGKLRKNYYQLLTNSLQPLVGRFKDLGEVMPVFSKGWPVDQSLQETLTSSLERDRRLGYTYNGSHRADFRIKVDGADVAHFGSRGQIKRIVLLLKFAQLLLFIQKNGYRCVLLIDDLASELDEQNSALFSELLQSIKLQILITSANSAEYNQRTLTADKMFHVKHGVVREMV